MSLYDELGGAPAVDAAVEIFYKKVLADDRINHFFTDMDMKAQHKKQATFLTMVMGGPNEYSGKDMRNAHTHLALEDVHMDAVIEHLGAALKELNVPDDKIAIVAGAAESMRNDVLNRR